MQERRAHPRYPTREFGILRELENGAETREQVAYVLNVSSFGIGLELDRSISVGTSIRLFVADYSFTGTVVYCRKDGHSFRAGIALSCDSMQPINLLNAVRHRAAGR